MKKYILLLIIITAWGCSTATLRDDSVEAKIKRGEKAEPAVAGFEAFEKQSLNENYIYIKATDQWESWSVRQFTPTCSKEQKIEAVIAVHRPYIEIKLEGCETSVKFDEGDTFVYKDGKWSESNSKWDRYYAEPLRSYIVWPYTLWYSPVIVEKASDKYYAADSKDIKNEATNEYLLHLEPGSKRVEIIEFTLRELADSYKGALQYRSPVEKAGMTLAKEIRIADGPTDSDYVHRFLISEIQILEDKKVLLP